MQDGGDESNWQRYLQERRKGRRFKVSWPIRVRAQDPDYGTLDEVTTLRDLSSRGAYAYISSCPQVGARLAISIRLPIENEIWMSYSASVVRVDKMENGAGIAFMFDTPRPVFGDL
jgi:hypothetical protein